MALHLRFPNVQTLTLTLNRHTNPRPLAPVLSIPILLSARHSLPLHHRRSTTRLLASVDQEETQLPVASDELQDASPEDLECVKDIQRVLDLLRKNRDMTIGEVKLVLMIEDASFSERKRLLDIDDPDGEITKENLIDALQEVIDGKIPKDTAVLKLLAAEMNEWPDLEVEVPKKGKRSQSLYAKVTDTGVDPAEAAKRLKLDWDSAADIEEEDDEDEVEVPPVLGYGALYLVTALPVLIGISVVLILFYNSLQ
ncbi:Caspase-like domain-containing protein [Dioscorea alata]|uniref:Caspase-like domain-containing protein n=1 Tax=Dioscorea alata TaxID=55571 RepID=A0ACB7UNK6_DIOAL|nr:Caspase-like domain-containing protein [Dioscorea alata]